MTKEEDQNKTFPSKETSLPEEVAQRATSGASCIHNDNHDSSGKLQPTAITKVSWIKHQDPISTSVLQHHGLHRTAEDRKAKLQVAMRSGDVVNADLHQHASLEIIPKKGLHTHTKLQLLPQRVSDSLQEVEEQHEEENEQVSADIESQTITASEHKHPVISFSQNQAIEANDEEATQSTINRSMGDSGLHEPRWISSTSDLVKARMVTEESSLQILQEAKQVSADEAAKAQEHKAEMRKRELQYRRLGYCLVAVALVILVISLVVITREPETSTFAPTFSPSMLPSSQIPADPYRYLNHLFVELPYHTRKSLQNITTPQWKAFDWLSHHTNISRMTERRMKQIFALATFYYAFEGERWPELIRNNWMDYAVDECIWFSSKFGSFLSGNFEVGWENSPFAFIIEQLLYRPDPCNDNNEFQALMLGNLELSNLAPSIPPEIALLTSLSVLDFPWNNIFATLTDMMPSELYEMENLKALNFGFNSITGMLPSELGLMTNLMELLLHQNKLSGTVPNDLHRMTSLTKLFLEGNSLNGPLPIALLHNMTNMTHLDLDGNLFSGPVPSELGQMRNMLVLWLGYNGLTGMLPTELGLMTGLTDLDISGNTLSGSLPSELGHLSNNMTKFWMWNNALTGLLPTELGLLTRLKEIDIGWNSLSGPLPSELGGMTGVEVLYINNNSLTGTICTEVGEMTSLVEFMLSDNSFFATIPSELGQLKNLSWLVLSNLTLMTGLLPSELSLMSSLKYLDLLGSIGLSGTVPSELCHLQSPECTFTDYYGGTFPCKLAFDCSPILCGCDCACSNGTVSNFVVNETDVLALPSRRNASE